jgi:hypothetical protein
MSLAAVAGTAWVGSNVAAWMRYRQALQRPVAAQASVLMRYLRENAGTRAGRRHGFADIRTIEEYRARVPLTSYDDLGADLDAIACGEQDVLTRDRVRCFGLSSGSVSAAKRIPHTATLQREFRRAIAPWIVDLYRRRPALASGSSYWSITPVAVDRPDTSSPVPVGFEEDTEYLGAMWKPLVDATLAVPGVVRFVRDIEAFRYVTLLFLLRRADLRLVSIWHPSFLTLLLGALPMYWDALLNDLRQGTVTPPAPIAPSVEGELRRTIRSDTVRAAELSRTGPHDCACIWPRLRLVSCWADGHAGLYVAALRRLLPHVELQPKGLLATEAVVTIPFRGLRPLAVRSHFFEFLGGGRTYLAHELVPGTIYTVVVTTGGGLYRYRLDDRVEVDGFVGATPSLRFLGKEDHVSDLCGEKLNETFVAGALADACATAGMQPRFALVAPDLISDPPCYSLYVEADLAPTDALGRALEERLSSNPHYRYCRALGQLGPLRVSTASAPMFPAYLQRCRDLGQRVGDVKPLALSSLSGWGEVFGGDRGQETEPSPVASPASRSGVPGSAGR